MAIKGTALASIAAGALFAYAGLTGKNIPKAIQAVITGKPPSTSPVTQPISLGQTGSVSGQVGQVGPVAAPSSASQKAWATAQLAAILAPPTAANIESLVSWANHESPWNASPPDGAEYTHNPLNTTDQSGAVGEVNSVNVAIYPDWPTGISSTAATLLGGNYTQIVARLRSGQGLCGWSSSEFSTWSGGGYDSVC